MPDKEQTPEPFAALGTGVQQLFDDKTSSDLVVRCQGVEYHLHKAILRSHGGYFSNAIKDNFKEGASGAIELSNDEDPLVIRALLGYSYGHVWEVPGQYMPAAFEAKMYAAADYYQLANVKARARHNFAAIAYRSKDPVAGAVSCTATAPIVYNTTPKSDRGLRQIIVDAMTSQIGKLPDNKFNEAALNELPDVALDLLIHLNSKFKGKVLDVAMACPEPTCGLIFGTDSSSNTTNLHWIPRNSCHCPGCGKKKILAEYFAEHRRLTGQQ